MRMTRLVTQYCQYYNIAHMLVIKVAFGNERVRESRCFPCGASRVQKLELNLTLLLANICRVLHYSFHDSQTHLWPRLDMRREFELGF